MGRPANGAMASTSGEMKKALLDLREKHPGWGPKTIRHGIVKDVAFRWFEDTQSGAAYLKEQGKVRKYERHNNLPEPQEQPVQRPHQEWEMDAQGVTTVAGLGKVFFINLLDVYSYVSVDSHACLNVSHPRSQEYQQVLRRAFVRYGLPEQISLDHDSAFYDNKSASPFPSMIHLWLIGLGVQVRFIHKRSPLQHSRIERHIELSLVKPLWVRPSPMLWISNAAYKSACSFSTKNTQLGHQMSSLPSRLFRRPGIPDVLTRSLQKSKCWICNVFILPYKPHAGFARLVQWVPFRSEVIVTTSHPTQFADQAVEITFNAAARELICLPEKSTSAFQLDIRGLTKTTLMGRGLELPGYLHYQLALPLAYPDTTF